jgi:hypothetical protein
MLEINATLDGFSRIDFDGRQIRKTMRLLGREVQKEARRLVARRAISGAGEYPGRQTGAMWRSIKYRVSRPGFLVRIQPAKTEEMGSDFYPAFLSYGSKKRNLAQRKNFMTDALDSRRAMARSAIKRALQDALVARK